MLIAAVLILFSACENKAASETAAPEDTAVPSAGLVLAEKGVCDYTVVRSDTTNGAEVQAAVLICDVIEERMGIRPKITTDWEDNPVTEHEIIVGNTTRDETENHTVDRTALGKNGYIIEAVGEKIFIAGGSEESTYTAAEYFLDTFAGSGSTAVIVKPDYKYAVYQEFDIRSLTICGKNFADFTIICDSSSVKEAADTFAAALADKTGKLLDIITDENVMSDYSASDSIILFTSKRPDNNGVHLVRAENGWLTFSSSSSETGIAGCVSRFTAQYIDGAKGDCSIPEGFTYAVKGDYISIKDPRNG